MQCNVYILRDMTMDNELILRFFSIVAFESYCGKKGLTLILATAAMSGAKLYILVRVRRIL